MLYSLNFRHINSTLIIVVWLFLCSKLFLMEVQYYYIIFENKGKLQIYWSYWGQGVSACLAPPTRFVATVGSYVRCWPYNAICHVTYVSLWLWGKTASYLEQGARCTPRFSKAGSSYFFITVRLTTYITTLKRSPFTATRRRETTLKMCGNDVP